MSVKKKMKKWVFILKKVSGFKKFVKQLNSTSHCVMEATGYYHYQLAYYLVEKGISVSVENPLSVKRFIQMKLSKVKTDSQIENNYLKNR